MRRRRLKRLWRRLGELQRMKQSRDALLMRLGEVPAADPGRAGVSGTQNRESQVSPELLQKCCSRVSGERKSKGCHT